MARNKEAHGAHEHLRMLLVWLNHGNLAQDSRGLRLQN